MLVKDRNLFAKPIQNCMQSPCNGRGSIMKCNTILRTMIKADLQLPNRVPRVPIFFTPKRRWTIFCDEKEREKRRGVLILHRRQVKG
jgi:hypothetical protein